MNRNELFRLVRLVEVKDYSTAAHTWRVALYTQAVAEDLNLEPKMIQRLMRGAVLHDFGKIDIPSDILRKPGRLDDEEWKTIRQHPLHGYDRLKRMGEDDPLVLNLVRSHHERLDGSGYPDGLVGEQIPFEAQMFSVIDSFDAMTSIRPYREAHPIQDEARAISELEARAGEWYAPALVERFLRLIRHGKLTWISKHFNDSSSANKLISPDDLTEISALASHHRPEE